MTATSSPAKLHGGRRLFWFTLRKNAAVIFLALAVLLLLCPGLTISRMRDNPGGFDRLSSSFGNTLSGNFFLLAFFTSALMLLLCCLNFDFLFHKNASDVYHALPVSRSACFLARFFASAVGAALPATASCAGLAILLTVVGRRDLLPVVGQGWALLLLFVLLCTASLDLAAVCTGQAFDLLVTVGIFNLTLPLLYLIGLSLCDQHLVGFCTENAEKLVFDLSPFTAFCYHLTVLPATGFDWNVVGFCVLFLLCFLVTAVLLYRSRRSEAAETPYAFAFVRRALQFFAAVFAGYFIGMLFYFSDNDEPAFWLFTAAGCLLGALILGGVMERGFRRWRRSALLGAGAFASLFALFLVIYTGAFGFETRLPSPARFASATVSFDGMKVELPPAQARELHAALLDDARSDDEDDIWNAAVFNEIRIDYRRANGSRLVRKYNTYLRPETTLTLLQSDAYRTALTNEVLDNTKQSATCVLSRREWYFTRAQMQSLLDAYFADLATLTPQALRDGTLYDTKPQTDDDDADDGRLWLISEFSRVVPCPRSFTHTRAFLEAHQPASQGEVTAFD